MNIEVDVEDDGTVTIQVPKQYHGKRIRVSIQEIDAQAASPQWSKLSEVLDGLEQLGTHRHSHLQIIEDLRRFREAP
ncbi:hypothetical protein [Thiocapsa bogorovii]|uniref:hypothetical protein n=1 Tax=Thiocapsa bogorovii TaxID=521689 RepID=UPI001E5BE8DC|nr:hypothetical protein [Thiocapsa bogorovii]UHD18362.1 hypothetical protein LT988_10155 [Thiocapsa bogorovii]